MISQQTVAELFRRYRRRPTGGLNLTPLRHPSLARHAIAIDDAAAAAVTIGSIDPGSPLRQLPAANICALVDLDECLAVVLPAAIIFLDRNADSVNVSLRPPRPSLLRRLLPFLDR